MKKLKYQRLIFTAIKMTLACLITTLIAYALDIENYLTAGVISVLSIHLTRRDSTVSAGKRLVSSLIGIFFSSLLFFLFGYEIWVYIIFILIFSLSSWFAKISEGIVPSIVLVTHLLAHGSFSWILLLNEIYIMLIALSVALILNIIDNFIRKSPKTLESEIDTIIIKSIIRIEEKLADLKKESKEYLFNQEINLKRIIEEIILVDKDSMFSNDSYLLDYAGMRKNQMNHLIHIGEMLDEINAVSGRQAPLKEYFKMLKDYIGKANSAPLMLEKLQTLLDNYKTEPLPDTRAEFETRAILYSVINEIKFFLQEKVIFHGKH